MEEQRRRIYVQSKHRKGNPDNRQNAIAKMYICNDNNAQRKTKKKTMQKGKKEPSQLLYVQV